MVPHWQLSPHLHLPSAAEHVQSAHLLQLILTQQPPAQQPPDSAEAAEHEHAQALMSAEGADTDLKASTHCFSVLAVLSPPQLQDF